MTEVVLFLIVGVITVISAVMMLLSENAVYSALFLVVNFVGVAFLYLMLNAPFLAILQIAVYAGAIMVLFLFVIMLFGAEKPSEPETKKTNVSRMSILAVALAGVFILVTYSAITRGQIDLAGPAPQTVVFRVVNAAPDIGAVDVLSGVQDRDVLNLAFGEASPYMEFSAGTFPFQVNQGQTSNVLAQADINFANVADQTIAAYTLIIQGEGFTPSISVVADNLQTLDSRTGRIAFYNATANPVTLMDFGSDNDRIIDADRKTPDDAVLVEGVAAGQSVELPVVSVNTDVTKWGLVDAANTKTELVRLRNPEVYSVGNTSSQLWVAATQRGLDGSSRTVVIPLTAKAVESFGSPASIGQLLFTRYMLPMQLVAVLLLAAMVGAIVLTHKEGVPARRRDVRRVVSKPLTTAISAQVGVDVTAAPETPKLPEGNASA